MGGSLTEGRPMRSSKYSRMMGRCPSAPLVALPRRRTPQSTLRQTLCRRVAHASFPKLPRIHDPPRPHSTVESASIRCTGRPAPYRGFTWAALGSRTGKQVRVFSHSALPRLYFRLPPRFDPLHLPASLPTWNRPLQVRRVRAWTTAFPHLVGFTSPEGWQAYVKPSASLEEHCRYLQT